MLPKVFFPPLKIGGSEELKLIGTHLRNLSVKNSSTAAHKPQNCPFFEGLGNNIGIKYLKCSDSFIRNPVMDSVLFSSTFPVLERLDLCVTVPHLINDTFSLLQFQVENVQCNFPSENLTTFNDVSGFLTRPAMEK
uniref:Uncharacterized protein n=1 Tax=Panagrolaimus superbus TaxID=310955 RepID=A0A914YIP5_9BILA